MSSRVVWQHGQFWTHRGKLDQKAVWLSGISLNIWAHDFNWNLKLHMCLCMFAYVQAHMWGYACTWLCACTWLMLGLILNYSFTLSKVGDVSPLTPELIDTASLNSQLLWGSPTLSHKARIKGKPPPPPALMWVLGGPNSAPHTCITNTLFKKGGGEKAQC